MNSTHVDANNQVQFQVTSLSADTSYTFIAYTVNHAGNGPPSVPETYRTGMCTPSFVPLHFSLPLLFLSSSRSLLPILYSYHTLSILLRFLFNSVLAQMPWQPHPLPPPPPTLPHFHQMLFLNPFPLGLSLPLQWVVLLPR